jgi:hypothetical protein
MITAYDFAYFINKNGKNMSCRLHLTLHNWGIKHMPINEIEQKDFFRIRQVGIKTWNEFVELRNNYNYGIKAKGS